MAVQRCAQVLGGVVENIILADPATFVPSDGSTVVASATAQIGWTYISGVFTPVTPPTAYPTTGLNFLDFMALFTAAEQVAVINSTDQQAKVFVAEAEGAPQLDLIDSRVVAGVNYLAAISLIAPSRVAAILAGAPPA